MKAQRGKTVSEGKSESLAATCRDALNPRDICMGRIFLFMS